MVPESKFDFSEKAIPVMFLSLILVFAVFVTASKGLAQSETPSQPGGQGTPPPASPPVPKPGDELPEGDGKVIATDFCQDCHKLTTVARARKAPDDWHDTVQLMMDRGARLPHDKLDMLVQYLAKNFGPQTAAPAPGAPPAAKSSPDSPGAAASQPPNPVVELPEGEGKAIATEYCQACHKLTNLTKAHKDRDDWHDTVQLMMDRGARLPQDKVDTLLDYLAKNFGPKAAAPSSGTGSADASPTASSTAPPAAPQSANH